MFLEKKINKTKQTEIKKIMVEVSMITMLFITATTYVDYISQMTDQTFNTFPDNWIISPPIESPITMCNGESILGGFGKMGIGASVSVTFNNIPLHSQVRVSFRSYTIDSWDRETVQYVIQDSHFSRNHYLFNGIGNLCGDGCPDMYFDEVFEIPHSQDTLTINFIVGLDEQTDNESWGIRNFILEILPIQCVQLYSECNYLGTMIEFCQGQPIQGNFNQPTIIKSVKVPGSGYLTLIKNDLEIITLKQNNPCLDQYDFPKEEYQE